MGPEGLLKQLRQSTQSSLALYLPCTYPLGRRDPEAVLLHMEATGEPHLQHEVQVLAVLCLPALPPPVSPHKVKETAGQDEEPTGVGRPGEERNPENLQEPSRDPGRPKQPSQTQVDRLTIACTRLSTSTVPGNSYIY